MHKLTKLYLFRFKVEGRGEFPFDMLRYDMCHPATQDDVSVMIHEHHMRHVNLRMYSGNKSGPTIERWQSFGWQVRDVVPLSL